MNNLNKCIRLVLMTLVALLALGSVHAATIKADVTGLNNTEGNVKIILYSKQVVTLPASKKPLAHTFKNLKPNTYYAIVAYHDTDADDQLDKGGFLSFIPKEEIGASNGAQLLNEEHVPHDAVFYLNTSQKVVDVKVY